MTAAGQGGGVVTAGCTVLRSRDDRIPAIHSDRVFNFDDLPIGMRVTQAERRLDNAAGAAAGFYGRRASLSQGCH
jgi:hypothetical protein